MSITIKPAQNGWLLIHSIDGEHDELMVFSHTQDDLSETEAFRDLLVTVDDLLGPTTNRYSPARIRIRVEPGDKHSSHPDNTTDED